MTTSTPRINGASQTGSILLTNGWSTTPPATLEKGAIFTIAGVFPFNSSKQLQQFVVRESATADANGNLSIQIKPAITIVGDQPTVSALPADGAGLTLLQLTTLPPLPSKSPLIGPSGFLTPIWSAFFVELYRRVGGPIAQSNSDLLGLVQVTQSSGQVTESDLLALGAQVRAVENGEYLTQGPVL